MNKPKILIYDLETSPLLSYTWGIYDQHVIKVHRDWEILSVAYKWFGEKTIHCKTRQDFDDKTDKSLVEHLWNLLDQADYVVAHNGDRFDNKKARTRFVAHGMVPPSPFISIDTRKEAKKYFNFNTNRLDELGRYLGLGRKEQTGGFELWEKCMSGDAKAWQKMKKYNLQDVKLLEQVYVKLRPWIKHPVNTNESNSCPKCGSNRLQSRGYSRTNTNVYKRYQCQDCGGWSRSRTKDKDFKVKVVSNS